MRDEQAAEAKAPVAGARTDLTPRGAAMDPVRDPAAAVAAFRARRAGWAPAAFGVDDILAARHAGHRV